MASNRLLHFRIVLWTLVALVAVGATWLYVFKPPTRPIGADGQHWALASTQGGTFTQQDLVGRPSLLFFGYTFCPDVCPTSLAETTAWRQQLGLKADDLRILFATVDPARDKLPIVKDYVEGFDPTIIGLVGDQPQTDAAKAAFRVVSEIQGDPKSSDYLVNHTASIFLIGADGTFRGTIAYDEHPDTALQKIRRLVQG